jgi:lambda family phage tail tape measure protein
MAADRKVEYEIEILATGEGAVVAQEQFKKVAAAATATGGTMTSFSGEVRKTREASRALHEGLRMLAMAGFPEASFAAMKVQGTLRAVTSAATALKVSVGAMGAGLAGLTAIVYAGGKAWAAYNAQLKEQQTMLDAAAASGRLALLQEQVIKQLGTNITPEQRQTLLSQLGQPGNGTTSQLLSTQQNAQRRAMEDAANGATVAAAQARLQDITESANWQMADRYTQERSRITGAYILQLREIQQIESEMGDFLTGRARSAVEDNYTQQMELATIEEHIRQTNQLRETNQRMHEENFEGWQRHMQQMDRAAESMNQYRQLIEGASQAFAQGLSTAIVDWASGVKDADDAFREFAQNFLRQIATMILQQLILNAIQRGLGALGFTSGSSGSSAAAGGIFPRAMAAGGIAGVDMVSRPTYFPRFNVLAGEAGSEWLTVLSRPRMMDLGGISAAVGEAHGRTMALAPAAQVAGGGGGRGVLEIRLSPGLQGAMVGEAIRGARVVVVQDMSQDSDLSKATRRLVA